MQLVFFSQSYGSWVNRVISWWTTPWRGRFNGDWKKGYSHVELLFNDGMMFSASQYENRCRYRKHSYTGKAWKRVPLETVSVAEEKIIREFCDKQEGKKYDYLGVAGFVFGNNDNDKKWFCSEISTKALQQVGLFSTVEASKVSPNSLATLLGVL